MDHLTPRGDTGSGTTVHLGRTTLTYLVLVLIPAVAAVVLLPLEIWMQLPSWLLLLQLCETRFSWNKTMRLLHCSLKKLQNRPVRR